MITTGLHPACYVVRRYVLIFREPGKRPGTTRWARQPVGSVKEAEEFMNADRANRQTPCHVQTTAWKPEVVAILFGPLSQ